jgi:transmembrane sensor
MSKNAMSLEPAIQQAIEWEVRLRDEQSSVSERERFEAWRQADPANDAAWNHLQVRLGKLASLRDASGVAVSSALRQPDRTRRNLLKAGAGVASLLLVGVGTRQLVQSYALDADYHNSGTNPEHLALGDVALTLGSSARIYTRTPQDGGIYLASGQILADGRAAASSFLKVSTREGSIEARGAQLSVDTLRRHTVVAVQGADAVFHVRGGTPIRLTNGATWSISQGRAIRMPETPGDIFAWTTGTLVVLDRAVPDLIETLGRYYSGYIRFPESVLSRHISGVFPLDNVESALHQLADALGLSLTIYGRALAIAT